MKTYDNSVADVLDAAATHIETHGWFQGHYCSIPSPLMTLEDVFDYIRAEKPATCALGSMVAVSDTRQDLNAAVDAFIDYLSLDTYGVPDWNDAPHQTKERVTEAMRFAALTIRAGNIGDDQREYEFEPFPATEPVKEPAAPEPAPAEEPVPA